jgi:hypothetical protein
MSVPRDDLLVRGDDRLAGSERRARPLGRRLEAANGFDHDVEIGGEDVADVGGPGDGRHTRLLDQGFTFQRGVAIEDVCELETGGSVGTGQAAGDGGTDGAKPEDCYTTAFTTHSTSSSLLLSAGRAGAEGRNWHLSRDLAVAWLPWRHRACPSATLDEARIQLFRGLYRSLSQQVNRYIHIR